jgi:hypothetical protein
MGLVESQLTEVALKCDEGYSICTGYAITNELILTAGHIIPEKINNSINNVEIRFAGKNEIWLPGEIIWEINEDNIDAALIKLKQKRQGEYKTCFGDISNQKEWYGSGFPNAGKYTTSLNKIINDTVGISGVIEIGGAISGFLDLTVEAAPNSAEQWKGLSGSPVFVDDYLIGIITISQNIFEGRRLKATSIKTLKKIRDFDNITNEVDYYSNNTYREKFAEIYKTNINIGNIDISINTPNRKIEKLNGLLNINEILSQKEREILFVSLYLFNLPTVIFNRKENFNFIEDSILQFSINLIQLVDEEQNQQSVSNLFHPHRGELLYALLRFVNFLDYEKTSLFDDNTAPQSSNILDWLIYLTESISTGKGFIKFTLRISPSDKIFGIDLLRYIKYSYDKEYNSFREIFEKYYIHFSRAINREPIYDNKIAKIPDTIKRVIINETEKIIDSLKPKDHLGEYNNFTFSEIVDKYNIDEVTPLPYSKILEDFEMNLPDSIQYSIMFVQVESDQYENHIDKEKELFPVSTKPNIVISKSLIVPNLTYRWYLNKNNPDFVNQITSGVFKTLSNKLKSQFLEMINCRVNEEYSPISIKYSFGLWNMLVSDIWNDKNIMITEDEILLLFNIFQSALVWLEQWDLESGKIEIYRNLVMDLYDIIKNDNLKK